MKTTVRWAGVLGLTLFLGACDSGPEGPGSFVGRASGESLGAVLLEVQGPGIAGFAGRGSTQVYSGGVPSKVDTYRVILVDPQGGDIGFEIEVEDLGMEGPIITVIQASRTDNVLMSPSGVAVSVER